MSRVDHNGKVGVSVSSIRLLWQSTWQFVRMVSLRRVTARRTGTRSLMLKAVSALERWTFQCRSQIGTPVDAITSGMRPVPCPTTNVRTKFSCASSPYQQLVVAAYSLNSMLKPTQLPIRRQYASDCEFELQIPNAAISIRIEYTYT